MRSKSKVTGSKVKCLMGHGQVRSTNNSLLNVQVIHVICWSNGSFSTSCISFSLGLLGSIFADVRPKGKI